MSTSAVRELRRRLKDLADNDKARHAQRFFKTGPGEYGEGDRFLGIRVPPLRKIAREYRSLSLDECVDMLRSRWHEERFVALLILVEQFERGDEDVRGQIYQLYLANTTFVNNWDLVDASAHRIVGPYLARRAKKPLYALAASTDLWERRIAMIATYPYIKAGRFEEALRVARMLLNDEEDLIHKAVGWMLRELGKVSLKKEEEFLRQHHRKMPRTMLRYAIEKFPEAKRKRYLQGKA